MRVPCTATPRSPEGWQGAPWVAQGIGRSVGGGHTRSILGRRACWDCFLSLSLDRLFSIPHTDANTNPRVKFPNPWLGLPVSLSAKLGSTLADTSIVTVHVGSCILLELNRLSKVKSSRTVGGGETEGWSGNRK